MSRALDPLLVSAITGPAISPVILAMLTFRSQTVYVWTGEGNIVYDAQTYVGIGSYGKMSVISEGIEVRADGMTVSLSGIDPLLQAECLTDIQIGAPAKVWFGNMVAGVLVGAPYLVFSGQVDKPAFNIGGETISISLSLENQLINHGRPNLRRYTSADQHIDYPNDTAFGWVEQLNDLALDWGQ